MSQSRYDAIVIGGGHNGLIAAALAAHAGRRTLLLEAGEELGGMAGLAPSVHRLSATVVEALQLKRRGLAFSASAQRTGLLREGRGPLSLDPNDPGATHRAIAGESAADADGWRRLQTRLARLAAGLAPFLEETPPRLDLADWGERWKLMKLGFAVRRMGRDDMRDLLRILPLPVADLAEEELETPELQGLLALDAVMGQKMGARSPNTVFPLVLRHAPGAGAPAGAAALVDGGADALIDALARAAREEGAEIRTDAPVARILTQDGVAVGVETAGGETIEAPVILSSAHPKTTLIDLVGPRALDADFVRTLRCARGEGMTARLDLALDGAPEAAAPGERLVHAPSLAHIETAFDQAKYGELPDDPPLEVTLESETRAAALVQYAPRTLRGTNWAEAREAFAKRLVDRMDALIPGLKARVQSATLTTPEEIEGRFAAPGGHWHHLELGLDQVFLLRPAPGWAQYRTPIEGLFLCGAGAHPGGGITGQPGLNGARAALAAAKAGLRRPASADGGAQ
ncbi:MAG: NAD(P)/FAD-dependent oxidoreductase [Marivibrio sp.]|uniref:phytoene desaturase family protein n=1 Tax=Marivibrio sp. TaxID=2039719 RepID=UPI0032F02113